MGWLKNTFKDVFTDPFDLFGDKTWGDLFDPGGYFDDPIEPLPPVEIEPEAKRTDFSAAKARQDIAARGILGIGGSRGRSRVVSPFGSGPVDRTGVGRVGQLEKPSVLPGEGALGVGPEIRSETTFLRGYRPPRVSPVSDMSMATSPDSRIDEIDLLQG